MKLLLKRIFSNENKTLGLLRILNDEGIIIENRIKNLELPDRNNKPFVSRIPAGIYPIKPIIRPNGDWALLLENVPNRTAILIHKGNYTRDIQGCILVGLHHIDMDKDGIVDVSNSTDAMKILQSLITEPTTIEIIDFYKQVGDNDPKTEPRV